MTRKRFLLALSYGLALTFLAFLANRNVPVFRMLSPVFDVVQAPALFLAVAASRNAHQPEELVLYAVLFLVFFLLAVMLTTLVTAWTEKPSEPGA